MYAFLLTLFIIIFFSVFLLFIIDYRLSKVEIHLPKQDVVVREHFLSPAPVETVPSSPSAPPVDVIPSNKPKIFELDKAFMTQDTIAGNSKTFEYKPWDVQPKETQVCDLNHVHNNKCTMGHMNYADPRDMSPIDLKIFILNYPPNMTLQDYIHWLYCYVGQEEKLSYTHLSHLQKLKMGEKLQLEEGKVPPMNQPPMKSEDYFHEMYNISDIDMSSTSQKSWLGYNEKKYGNEYSDCGF
jgi:hypothetical protein